MLTTEYAMLNGKKLDQALRPLFHLPDVLCTLVADYAQDKTDLWFLFESFSHPYPQTHYLFLLLAVSHRGQPIVLDCRVLSEPQMEIPVISITNRNTMRRLRIPYSLFKYRTWMRSTDNARSFAPHFLPVFHCTCSDVRALMAGFASPFDQPWSERRGDDFLALFRLCLELFDSEVSQANLADFHVVYV